MKALLSAAGRAYLRAFLAALLVLSLGVVHAGSLHDLGKLGLAALLGAAAAGIRTLQAYVPQVSLAYWLGHPYGDWADSFLHAFLGVLIVTVPGVLGAPDLRAARALGVAAVLGAFTAGMRALQGTLTVGEHPGPATGILDPRMPYSYTAARR